MSFMLKKLLFSLLAGVFVGGLVYLGHLMVVYMRSSKAAVAAGPEGSDEAEGDTEREPE